MRTTLPSSRRLVLTWATLMGLTLISMISARLDADAEWQALPLWGALLVLVSTGFKAHQVLMTYLNLRVSSPGWKGAFLGLALVILGVILSGYLAARHQLLG
ncbi:Cytochrome C oxidase subunit IV [Modicisalibacter ilicicola DSM 19980]|uniref:Cytochrome C oxidase subunit IV n=1 Tax=Modicisalibacter ilicicola DSM 19980 TaxID=1121942 RepID=A0A1M4SNG4_9GAMM|nr:cytochrome C oxidase subunit IV family protein [Halomonas ilicicola]SHE33741.1 Cytochrome C oxidase subunit IV [Halomonas ilicicola DSM 19980]